jgi:hypothetical protein
MRANGAGEVSGLYPADESPERLTGPDASRSIA